MDQIFRPSPAAARSPRLLLPPTTVTLFSVTPDNMVNIPDKLKSGLFDVGKTDKNTSVLLTDLPSLASRDR